MSNGTCSKINEYEDDGWRVKYLECHVQEPERMCLHALVVFEKLVIV